MSNTTIRLSDLSFDGIKSDLREFLSNQSSLRDYNFAGSNLSALIDLLAYNTQQNAYVVNMLLGEMFLDTAQVFETVASHAKELGYVPRSARSSRATVTLTITPNDSPTSITVPSGTLFTTAHQGQSFIFSTLESYIAQSIDDYAVANVEIVEGRVVSDAFTFQDDPDQQFIISNKAVDTSTITVEVITSGSSVYYDRASSLLDYTANSTIYFISPYIDGRYQVTFGDDVVGAKPAQGSNVIVRYLVSSKELSNGADSFILNGNISGYTNVSITVTSAATGGAEREDIESIRYYAPRFYQARERAVTASDYQVLLKANFPEIRALNAYGGETLDPPQYGATALCIDLEDADGVSDNRKEAYRTFIIDRCPNTIRPIFIDPDFLDINFNVNVTVDKARASLSLSRISALVNQTVEDFANTNLLDFNSTLYISKLQKAIDDTDTAIEGNSTSVTLIRRETVANTDTYAFELKYHNEIRPNTFVSSTFYTNGSLMRLEDDGNGVIYPHQFSNNDFTMQNSAVGTIDYTTGIVDIDGVDIDSQSSTLDFYAEPANQVISTINNSLFRTHNVSVNVT